MEGRGAHGAERNGTLQQPAPVVSCRLRPVQLEKKIKRIRPKNRARVCRPANRVYRATPDGSPPK